MSYAAPFSLLPFHLPDRDDSAEERLAWPLAGSLVIHAFVFIAFLSLRFGSSLEQSPGSYEVTLVTLPAIASSPAASPENTSRPERNADKVPPPKAEAKEVPKVAPQTKEVSSPNPVPQEKPRVPELVTDSLVGALESVVVPKPQALVLPQKAASVPASAPPPAHMRQAPAVDLDVQPVQAPPQPPKLASGPVTGKSETSTPAPKVDLLAKTLKQAVGTIVVPKKPKQDSRRVTVTSEGKRKQDVTRKDTARTPRSSGITLPSRAPRLAAVAPPEAPKKETPRQPARKSSTVESLPPIPPVPEFKKPQPVETPSRVVLLVPETSPKPSRPAEARNQPSTIVSSQALQLAKVPVEQSLVDLQPAVPKTTSEPDTLRDTIDNLSLPELVFDAQPVSKQTESGTEGTLGLRVAGFCSPTNPYWENVEEKIDKTHRKIYRYHYRVESPAILTFRAMRNGQVEDLAVVRSSGNKKFDLVAKRAVLAAVPLPPFPANMTKPFCQVQHKFKVKPNR